MLNFENHAFRDLDESFKRLHGLLIGMAEHIQSLTQVVIEAAETKSDKFAQAKEIDRQINEAEKQISFTVEQILSKFHPLGEELRFVIGSIKIAGILESIADKIKNVTKRLPKVEHPLSANMQKQVRSLADILDHSLHICMQLLVQFDASEADALEQAWEKADAAYKNIVQELTRHLGESDADENKADYSHILLLAKNLERSVDSVQDIIKISRFIHHRSFSNTDKE